MGREYKGDDISKLVEEYLELARENDSLPITVVAIAELVDCSRASIYNYKDKDLAKKIRLAAKQRKLEKRIEQEPLQQLLKEALETITFLQLRMCLIEYNAVRLSVDSNDLYQPYPFNDNGKTDPVLFPKLINSLIDSVRDEAMNRQQIQ